MGCYDAAKIASPVGPIRLSLLPDSSCPRDNSDEQDCAWAQPRGLKQFSPPTETVPLPCTAVIKGTEKEHLGPAALHARMRPSVRT